MAPDLNSLPPSRSLSSSPMQTRPHQVPASPSHLVRRETPSPRSSSISLAATASMNAADLSRRNSNTGAGRGSPRAGRAGERRRSSVAMNLNLNDPTLPAPGELSSGDHRSSLGHYAAASPSSIGGNTTIATGDPNHHQRNPSLGSLHQELESEQEAQVNRLLQMIRTQHQQLEAMQRQQAEHSSRHSSQQSSTAHNSAVEDSTPTSDQHFSPQTSSFPILPPLPRPARRSSRTGLPPSGGTSPALRPFPTRDLSHGSIGEQGSLQHAEGARRNSARDEVAFYQAETASVTRENQMLRARIRELEKQISENTPNVQANSPAVPSNLAASPPVDGDGDTSLT